MRRLVYLSPVPWAGFSQRPHKFVEWHHAHHAGRVLWLEPYPTRLPQWGDLRRFGQAIAAPGQAVPPWLEVLRIPALPLEPLPVLRAVNDRLWPGVLRRVAAFAAEGKCDLVIGKPTRLALKLLGPAVFDRSTYDAMDDFPAFHGGISGRSMAAVERVIAARVDRVYASSSRLEKKFASFGAATTQLVRNACDPGSLPPVRELAGLRQPNLVGYVGTLAGWFDWNLVCALARARPRLQFRLIGPMHTQPPAMLPSNIELRPACSHGEAMREMASFGVGLIPFRTSPLTAAVDPVKYYEYRALGVPVLATAFGEMPAHAAADRGVLLADHEPAELLDRALEMQDDAGWLEDFRRANSWRARFAATEA